VHSSDSIIDLSSPEAVQAVASAASLAKAVSIRQPAPCSSGSVIDLSALDAVLAVASPSPAKAVIICQPAPRSSSSVIDLSAPDVALALASTSLAKPVFGLSSGIVIGIIAGIDAVKENCVLANNHALAIVVGQKKLREQEAAHRCRELEESWDQLYLDYDWLYLDYWSQRDVIDDLKAQLANNNANLTSELQENITSLEEAAEVASWTDWSQRDEIRRLEGIVDSKNISRMEESIDREKIRNCMLSKDNCHLGEVGRLQAQIKDLWASCPGMKSKMEYPPSKESTSCAACVGGDSRGRGLLVR